MSPNSPGRLVGALALCLPCCTVGEPALAQAWLPPKGWTAITFTAGVSDVGNHLFSSTELGEGFENGTNEFDLGDIDTRLTSVGFQYGISERFAIGADVAFVNSRYVGSFPENPAVDDGEWHGSLADFRAVARVQAYRGAVVVTPFAGVLVPTHDYEHHGHAAAGKGLWELPIGTSIGMPFGEDRVWSYLMATVAYTFVEKIEGLRVNRSSGILEFGCFPTDKLVLRVQGGWQQTHGGVDWLEIDDANFGFHDAAADSDFWSAGAGVSYSIHESVDLFVNWNGVLHGENAHELSAWTTGMSWNIGPGSMRRRKIGGRFGPEEAALERDDGSGLARATAPRIAGP